MHFGYFAAEARKDNSLFLPDILMLLFAELFCVTDLYLYFFVFVSVKLTALYLILSSKITSCFKLQANAMSRA